MTLSVIIPMYNERSVIADSLGRLADALEKAASAQDGPFDRYEILISDDGSDDGSGDLVR